MSVLMSFAMFPTDAGISVSEHVSKIVDLIKNSGYKYSLNAMSTVVETENIHQALELIEKAYSLIEDVGDRAYCTISFDIQKNKPIGRIDGKINSIKNYIGEVNS